MSETKEKKKKIDHLDERSDQVKEILGAAPGWMIRWGTTVVFIIVVLLIVESALIRYDDIIMARITITTRTPPAYIEANSSGKLTGLFVKADQSVKEGEVLAEIENTADLRDVYKLRDRLSDFTPRLIPPDSIPLIFPPHLKLGSVRQAYSDFVSQYQKYVLFNILEPNRQEIMAATQQIEEQYELLDKQQNQLELFAQELALSESEYARNKALLDKGVISRSEFETISRSYLADKQRYENLKSSVSNTRIAIASLSGSKTQSTITGEELSYSYRQQLEGSLEILKNEIHNWELTNILKSPMKGKVSMFDIRHKYQNVQAGDIVFTVVPEETDSLIGQVTMPVQNSGKVKVGQEVIIKLDNYPYQEWGSLQGHIVDISAVPKKGEAIYSIYVNVGSLETSFDKKLEFRQEMQGNAEIITEELSILQRIFYQLNKIFSRN
ncbi:HlyD family secretion protein [Sinomicrobium weinanense]|uniref:HlyD family efflux transporter periplasmic adaptor subunit n=1 Tax=Sinomicrobium weinanense TaxID=2842200 RepID=A0A926Q3J7_9FLAO|nr:HlyD family efflux transporter periplasmic adaptor subunit [Sinomicrobium weinanense]MBC9797633.1 HlyD family efflux transporter periplasmic adaptor subunit [Sinomicrobium weinanense]MBU3125253.1 HlyD family secretion protein [Sinomicrobium weinanense]